MNKTIKTPQTFSKWITKGWGTDVSYKADQFPAND